MASQNGSPVSAPAHPAFPFAPQPTAAPEAAGAAPVTLEAEAPQQDEPEAVDSSHSATLDQQQQGDQQQSNELPAGLTSGQSLQAEQRDQAAGSLQVLAPENWTAGR